MATAVFQHTNTVVQTVTESTARRALPSYLFAVSASAMAEAADDAEWEGLMSSPGFAKLIAQAKARVAAGQITPMRIEDL